MIQRFYFLTLIIILAGCSTQSDTHKDIEFISYHWSSYGHMPWHINYHIYALIDKSGKGKISVHKLNSNGKNEYLKIKIDEVLIKKIFSASEKFMKDSKLSYKNITEGMMDEPNLKIRVNNLTGSNTISFIETDRFIEIQEFVKLFRCIDSLYMTGNYMKLNDTADLVQRREDFIKYVMRIDSTLCPVPPPALEERRK